MLLGGGSGLTPGPVQFQNSPEPDLEIVMCSGYGKNGALSVLQVCGDGRGRGCLGGWVMDTPLRPQRSIRPQVVTTFELPGCYDMWTVIAPVRKEQVRGPQAGKGAWVQWPGQQGRAGGFGVRWRGSPALQPGWVVGFLLLLPSQEETPKGEGAEQEPGAAETDEDARRHGFLILSREDSTMVRGARQGGRAAGTVNGEGVSLTCRHPQILQTGQEIMELDTSGFATQGPTVFAGNIGDNRYIVQVSPLGIRLLEGGGPGWAGGQAGSLEVAHSDPALCPQ